MRNDQSTQDQQESCMEFPCQFPIKAMGVASEGLPLLVFEIVKRHAPDTDHDALTQRASKNGKYVSITVTIEATSRAQLDAIYQDLTASDQIMMAL
jgi:putative lipoic acid-binding regulatory protein